MNIFVTSLSLILIGVAMIYPVFFMAIDKQVQRSNVPRSFLQTNFLIHVIAGALSVILYWIYSVNYPLQLAGTIYLVVIVAVSLFYWNSELTKWNLFTASIIFGFIVFYRSMNEIVEITPLWPGLFTGLLGSIILSIILLLFVKTFYQTEYTEDKSLNTQLLKYLFIVFGIRIAWQLTILFSLSVATQYGEVIIALKFFWQSDTIKLILLIISGTIIPLFYLVYLKKKISDNNFKNRWVLVIILFVAFFTAEFLNKYFLLQFGIVL